MITMLLNRYYTLDTVIPFDLWNYHRNTSKDIQTVKENVFHLFTLWDK